MKKICAMIMAAALLLTLCACNIKDVTKMVTVGAESVGKGEFNFYLQQAKSQTVSKAQQDSQTLAMDSAADVWDSVMIDGKTAKQYAIDLAKDNVKQVLAIFVGFFGIIERRVLALGQVERTINHLEPLQVFEGLNALQIGQRLIPQVEIIEPREGAEPGEVLEDGPHLADLLLLAGLPVPQGGDGQVPAPIRHHVGPVPVHQLVPDDGEALHMLQNGRGQDVQLVGNTDLNNDGSTNTSDLILLLRYVNGQNITIS